MTVTFVLGTLLGVAVALLWDSAKKNSRLLAKNEELFNAYSEYRKEIMDSIDNKAFIQKGQGGYIVYRLGNHGNMIWLKEFGADPDDPEAMKCASYCAKVTARVLNEDAFHTGV